jgi:pyroglutamyl-peptidase
MPPHSTRPTVLLTGFGPFPGVPVNMSWSLVERLLPAATAAFPSFRFQGEQIVTEWTSGTQRIIALVDAVQPTVALHFGVSRKANGFVIETRGYNSTSAVADACGATPEPDALGAGSPDMLTSQLPVALIADRLRRRGLPVEISRDAGRYLCNAVLFHSLDVARRRGWNMRASGFIHLPTALPVRARTGTSQLTMAQATDGGLEIVAACLGMAPVRRNIMSRAQPFPPPQ